LVAGYFKNRQLRRIKHGLAQLSARPAERQQDGDGHALGRWRAFFARSEGCAPFRRDLELEIR
jgi:hypothetical protein